jgi:hypothetical protein
MGQWVTKSTGDTLTAAEWNLSADEIENLETTGSVTPSSGSSDQQAKAVTNIAANADYYTDGGVTDAYVLSVISPNKAPTVLRVGQRIRWRTSNINTGASTVNVAGLGIKNIKKEDGSTDPSAGDISISVENEAVYDGTVFRLKSNVEIATVASEGIFRQNKYFGYGFVPRSGSNPDEDVTIDKPGVLICEDGSTYVTLTAIEVDLDIPTLFGGALGNDTTYYLFRYLKSDDTMQWHVEASLTPTIGDIKSALAYRIICPIDTDSSGDIYKFSSKELSGGGLKIKFATPINLEAGASTSASQTIVSTKVASGLEVDVMVSYVIANASSAFQTGRIYSPDGDDVSVSGISNLYTANTSSSQNDGSVCLEITTNTSSQIHRRENASNGVASTVLYYYKYYRNNF